MSMQQPTKEITERPREESIEHVRDERRVTPPVDVYENKDELLVIVDVPGAGKDGLSIQLEDGQLDVEARQSAAFAEGGFQPLVFARSFKVPSTIDQAKVSAELDNGVLKVHLPKSELAKPRRIAIKTG
jgi:HSP20 family molecular chaperone IbpA